MQPRHESHPNSRIGLIHAESVSAAGLPRPGRRALRAALTALRKALAALPLRDATRSDRWWPPGSLIHFAAPRSQLQRVFGWSPKSLMKHQRHGGSRRDALSR